MMGGRTSVWQRAIHRESLSNLKNWERRRLGIIIGRLGDLVDVGLNRFTRDSVEGCTGGALIVVAPEAGNG